MRQSNSLPLLDFLLLLRQGQLNDFNVQLRARVTEHGADQRMIGSGHQPGVQEIAPLPWLFDLVPDNITSYHRYCWFEVEFDDETF
jgi:hypothetical protein